MSRKITTVISFKIESKFEEWVKILDSKKADLRHFNLILSHYLEDSVKLILKKLFLYIRF